MIMKKVFTLFVAILFASVSSGCATCGYQGASSETNPKGEVVLQHASGTQSDCSATSLLETGAKAGLSAAMIGVLAVLLGASGGAKRK